MSVASSRSATNWRALAASATRRKSMCPAFDATGLDRPLRAVEAEVVGALRLPPEAGLDLVGQPLRLGPQPGRRSPRRRRPRAREAQLRLAATTSAWCSQMRSARGASSVGVERSASLGVLPALVVVAAVLGPRLVLLQPVPVAVAVRCRSTRAPSRRAGASCRAPPGRRASARTRRRRGRTGTSPRGFRSRACAERA